MTLSLHVYRRCIDAVNCAWALTLACPRAHSECAVFLLRPGEEDDTECLFDYSSVQDRTRVSPTSDQFKIYDVQPRDFVSHGPGSPVFLVQRWKAGWFPSVYSLLYFKICSVSHYTLRTPHCVLMNTLIFNCVASYMVTWLHGQLYYCLLYTSDAADE